MVSSRVYPSLERKPGGPDNWVERSGGLPSYIERIAKHLHYEQGKSISHSIAAAVNTIKRWAKGGTVTKYGTTKRITPKTQALAIKALAEWNAKRAAGKINLSEAEFALIDLSFVSDEFVFDLTAEKCSMCDRPATKKVIWADGRAYQPSCDDHVKDVQDSLKEKNGDMTELTGVQDLSDADVEDDDTMTALMLPKEIAEKIAVEGGVPVEDMHITLTFHKEVDDDQMEDLASAVQAFCSSWHQPLVGKIGGIGHFEAKDPEKGIPYFAEVHIPDLERFQERLSKVVGYVSDYGDYTPHVTLTYVKEGEDPPQPVPEYDVAFTRVHIVRGNMERIEAPLGTGAGVDLTEHGTLSAMDIEAWAARANAVSDPHQRGLARARVLNLVAGRTLAEGTTIDLASTIPPRNARGRASDGRKSFAGQGKFKHGFIPVNQAAKEAKAKGSPIAMKRMKRLFGADKAPDDPRKSTREVPTSPSPIPSKVATAKYADKAGEQVKADLRKGATERAKRRVEDVAHKARQRESKDYEAATGRVGQRSAGGRKNDAKSIKIDEKMHPGSESASSAGFLRNTKIEADGKAIKQDAGGDQMEASKASRIPKRATQNWDEIPDNLKTVRNGERYVVAEFGGTQYVTKWVGGIDETEGSALSKRKVMSSLTSADANNMSPAALRDLVNNPQTPDSVKKVARAAARAKGTTA